MADVDNITISKCVLDALNAWPTKPATVMLEQFDKEFPAMMMQHLAGNPYVRRYINGSFIGRFPFAVYIRVNGEDTAGKIEALSHLQALCKYLTLSRIATLGTNRTPTGLESTSTPSIAAEYENGMVDFQTVFELQYKQGG